MEKVWGLCDEPLWNRSMTWDTSDPYFTHCFEETVLGWTPAIFLFIFFPIDQIISLKSKTIKFPKINVTQFKWIICYGLLSLHSILLLRIHTNFTDNEEIHLIDTITPVIRILSYGMILLLMRVSQKRDIKGSGVQFIFWFLTLISEIIIFRTAVSRINFNTIGTKMDFKYLTRLISLPLVIIQVLFHCGAKDCWNFGKSKNLINNNPSPEKSASFFSKIIYLWFDRMAWKGYKNPLEYADLWDLNEEDRSAFIAKVFNMNWDKAKAATERKSKKSGKEKNANIISVLLKCYFKPFLAAGILKLIADLLIFAQPEMLKLLVDHVKFQSEESWKGFFYAGILLVTSFLSTLFSVHSSKRMYRVAIRIKSALCIAIYRKSLSMSTSSKQESTVGEIVNLMSVDSQRFVELMPIFWIGLTAPIRIGLATYFLYNTLGSAIFAGLGVMLLLIPINGFIATKERKIHMKQMELKDQRVKLMNEIFSGIKVIKLYGWESSFKDQINEIRSKELILLKRAAYLSASTMFSFTIFPFLVALATFATFVYQDEKNILNAENAFVSLSLLNILRTPLTLFPSVLALSIQTFVSAERIDKYMNSEELDKKSVTFEKIKDPIKIVNGSFSWTEDITTLRKINLTVKSGSLTAIVGKVGSGKSSLLNALLGDLKKNEGYANVNGSVAYVAQGAWIQNASLRENVLCGDQFLDGKYKRVIEACALRQDLDNLGQAGDKTEIGEKGVNLSGGQRQRVALARAAYKESDIYLLDDPLSAVDSHVGKHLFEELICGLLKDKTRLLVTHSISFLSKVDNIIVMKEGEISESGNFQELLKNNGEFAEILLEHLSNEEIDLEEIDEDNPLINELEKAVESSEKLQRTSSIVSTNTIKNESFRRILQRLPSKESIRSQKRIMNQIEFGSPNKCEKLIEAEKLETGNVSSNVIKEYFKSAGRTLIIACLCFLVASQGLSAYSNIWLSDFSKQATLDENATNGTQIKSTTNKYISVYGAFVAGQAITVILWTIILAFITLRSAKSIHEKMLNRIFGAPMSYYHTTPLGRLVNRFSRDVDTVDILIPINIRGWLGMPLNIIATFVVISYSTPIFIAFIVPITILYFFLQRFYVATSRQLKRMESASRSPIYSQFSETISGLSTIRAFKLQDVFIKDSAKKIDKNQQAFYLFTASNIWVSLRIEIIGSLIIFASAIFSIMARSTIDPGIVGLSISYALQITSLLNYFVRIQTELETNIVSIERMVEITKVPQEAAFEIDEMKPKTAWPQNGEVVFEDYQTRYREGLELVLKGIDCRILPGEKIGVVGRTGAGKSSLTLALFRLIEATKGRIIIDGVDISQLGLHDLRSKLTIIPQDPVLFSGSLRVNLDPFKINSDDRIWDCIRLAHMHEFVKNLPGGLDHPVGEDGSNFSVGQRQLICLTRALLRKTKILILDEASSSLDLETDELLQKTIKTEFKECTIITIAHRLNTIYDSDRVIVLDKGVIVEIDDPKFLLSKPSSIFYKMANEANII